MKKTGKPHLPVEAFFNLLGSLKNEVGWVQAPGGHSLLKFLSEKTGIGQQTALKKLDELAKLGYIQKDFRGNILWRIKILISEWDESRLQKKQEKEKLEPVSTPVVAASVVGVAQEKNLQHAPTPTPELSKPAKPQEKRFAIFMDYVNLEKGLPKSTDRFKNFSWLLNPILEKGKLIHAFVFIPDHYASRAPLMQFTHKYRFTSILCPRRMSGAVTKDVDMVDTQMIELAWVIIDHSDITDLIIVAGDGDFQGLVTHALWQQKNVKIISAAKAISGRYLEMEEDGSLSVQLVS